MNLRTKFFLWTTALVASIVLGVGALTIISETRLISAEMRQNQAQTVQRLAKVCEESLYQSDVVIFNYFETLKSERGFISAAFLDSNGKVQAQSQSEGTASSGEIVELSAPVVFAGSDVGTARLRLSRAALQSHIRAAALRTVKRIGAILIAALLFGFAGAFFLTRSLVNPIEDIVKGMEGVSHGRLEPIPLESRQDELGWLGTEINATIGKLRELDELKRNFFSRVTHDLRSPLIGIQGLVSLLLKGQFGTLTTSSQEALVDVSNFSVRLSALIDDLLTTAKLDAGREDVDLEAFDIREIIREVSKFYVPLAQERGVALVLDLPAQRTAVHADRDKVLHVLTNLVSNAYKFTKEGTVTVSARGNKNEVRVAVCDTGVGIADSERPKIFDRFYQVKATRKVKGSGLGLFIVKSLLELQKGRISVSDNGDRGTRFTFTLPAA